MSWLMALKAFNHYILIDLSMSCAAKGSALDSPRLLQDCCNIYWRRSATAGTIHLPSEAGSATEQTMAHNPSPQQDRLQNHRKRASRNTGLAQYAGSPKPAQGAGGSKPPRILPNHRFPRDMGSPGQRRAREGTDSLMESSK